jgi:hypothetical protein
MTTKVTVEANHGWPVDVFAHDKPADADGGTQGTLLARVPANSKQDFYVHSGRDIFIHEVQPDELTNEAQAS